MKVLRRSRQIGRVRITAEQAWMEWPAGYVFGLPVTQTAIGYRAFARKGCALRRLRHPKIVWLRCARMERGAFMGGPIRSVSEVEMEALRAAENIELALEGFRNRLGAALDDRIREGGLDPTPYPEIPDTDDDALHCPPPPEKE